MAERGLFTNPIPPEKRTECRVAVPVDKDCYALANSFRQLSDQLLAQRGRKFTKIRLDRETRMIAVELEVLDGGANETIQLGDIHP